MVMVDASSSGRRRFIRFCAVLSAVAGMTLAGGLSVSGARADDRSSLEGDGNPAHSAQSLPRPLVDYDFAAMPAGASAVADSAAGSPFGQARLLTEGGSPARAVKTDGSLVFDGSYYVKLPDDILKGRASATVSILVRNDPFNGSGPWTYLWSLGGTGQTGKGSWATSTHTSLYTSITSKGNGDGETFFSASRNLSTERFETLTATVDGRDDMVRLYVNGIPVGSSKASTNPAAFGDHTHDVIGFSRYPGLGDAIFHGAVKSFTVYEGALTPGQIAATLPSEGVSDLLDNQAGSLTVPASAVDDFTLPTSTGAAVVTWTSSDPAALKVDQATGRVHVNRRGSDVAVTLTARLTPVEGVQEPSKDVTRDFDILVPRHLDRDAKNRLLADAVAIEDAGDIRGDFLLPATVSLPQYRLEGSMTWTSSDPALVKVGARISGSQQVPARVTRPTCGGGRTVSLTAVISPAGSTDRIEKVVKVTVKPESAGADTTHSRVSVHDPGVVKANGKYYLFGSHRAWARSTDLKHWEPFTNNLSTDYKRILAPVWNAWPKQESNPDVTGNMWAPDVIWNPTMRKWCMYLSLNGGGFPYQKSVMVLLTADDIEGDWTLVGPVIYSGFQPSNVDLTDVPRVLGRGADLTRYESLEDTGVNMIDACVRYDGQGGLWMSFGSWFGGIWLVKLDPATGLRDYRTTYETKPNVSDAYYGHKLAGGFGNSGEGSALVHRGDWWYLMLSYGGLSQTGGYQMREFRSRSITGPYLDQNGKPAVYGRKIIDDKVVNRGLRITGSYIQPGQESVQTSQGGNALLVDGGRVFNVYHTRFVRTSGNLEEHQVRVNEMVTSPDGWLVMAPFEYSDGVGAVTADRIPGDYSVVVHDPTRSYAGSGLASDAIYVSRTVSLRPGGRLAGQAKGTWVLQGSALTINVTSSDPGVRLHGLYRATVGSQTDEAGRPVVFFSGVGGDVFPQAGEDVSKGAGAVAIWGSRPVPFKASIVSCQDPQGEGAGNPPTLPTGTVPGDVPGGEHHATDRGPSPARRPAHLGGPARTEDPQGLARTGSIVIPALAACLVALCLGSWALVRGRSRLD